MKMPRFVIRVGAQDFVIASKEGVGALTELMAEAIPVNERLHRDPPEIELSYGDQPHLIPYLQKVRCQRIPANVVWTQKNKAGEVEVIRPVAKAPKALKGSRQKALPGRKQPALPAPNPQLALTL